LDGLREAGGSASTLGFADFGPRRMCLPFASYESAEDRLGERARLGK